MISAASKKNVFGRIYTVSLHAGERYYLCILLLQVPGASSFHDL